MRAVITRVKNASVSIDGNTRASIEKGFLILLGIHVDDTEDIAKKIADKICGLRVFEDESGKLDEQVYYDPPEEKVHTTDLIDNMIDLGTAREMIVVTPTFYNNSDNMNEYQRNREQDQFVYELRRDILPLIVKNFSTYAAEPTEAAISAAREHFAYAGLSMGSIYGYNAVLPLCLDLFGWFGQFSGAECYTDLVISALNSENNAPYPIYWFYNTVWLVAAPLGYVNSIRNKDRIIWDKTDHSVKDIEMPKD